MKTDQSTPRNIDEYIAGFPHDVQAILEKIRRTIRKAAPDAEETIKYQMPTFTLKGHLVYFAAWKKHIGFYPPVRDEKLKRETAIYEGEKGNKVPTPQAHSVHPDQQDCESPSEREPEKGRREEKKKTDCVVTLWCRSTRAPGSRWPCDHPVYQRMKPTFSAAGISVNVAC